MFRFFHWLALLSAGTLLGWSAAAGMLTYGAAWTPWILLTVALVHLVAVGLYGDWALNRYYTSQVYVYWIILYFLEILLIVLGAIAMIRIEQVRCFRPADPSRVAL